MVAEHCATFGRDPSTLIHSANIETTVIRAGDDPEELTKRYRRDQTLAEYKTHAVVGGAQEIIDTYARVIEAGMDYIIVSDVPGLATTDVIEFLGAEVLPAFK